MSYLTTILQATAGHADGLNLGVLKALAERVESDFSDQHTADQLDELHDKLLTDAVAKARACTAYDHAFATAYTTAYATFDQQLTVAQANEIFDVLADYILSTAA